jgi:hypothetical protein
MSLDQADDRNVANYTPVETFGLQRVRILAGKHSTILMEQVITGIRERDSEGVVTAINASKSLNLGSVLTVDLKDGANGSNCTSYSAFLISN